MIKHSAKFINLFVKRKAWIRRVIVASLASATAWIVGDQLVPNGGLVAAIVCALSIRISLYKSVREGFGQIIGTAIGASVALLTVHYFNFGFFSVSQLTREVLRLSNTIARLKLKGIDGDPHKRWSMWFNSKIRAEPYQPLTCLSRV